MTANVFVMGLDETNLETLCDAPRLEKCRFLPLLTVEELWSDGEAIPLEDLLDRARTQLDAFDQIDAIVGYWDFPVSSLVPILCAERGLRARHSTGSTFNPTAFSHPAVNPEEPAKAPEKTTGQSFDPCPYFPMPTQQSQGK